MTVSRTGRLISTFMASMLFVVLLGVSISPNSVAAAATNPLAIVYYGSHSSSIDQRIINARPEILIDNTPGGFWGGSADSAKFQSQGIKVFSYIHASWGAYSLTQNYAFIDAIAREGTYGVFVDEASPSATTYNTQLAAYAHSKGLKVIFNPGTSSINANMYSIADFVMTDEHYQGRNPTSVEAAHLSQTIVVGFGNWTAQQAAGYTNTAWAKGFRYSWHEQGEYTSLPTWLEEYVSLLSIPGGTPAPTPSPTPLPTPVPAPIPAAGNVTGVVASSPVSSGGNNEYNLYVKINSTTVAGLSAGQQVWVAASKLDFPNLLTVGSTVTGNLDKSLGWWVMKPAASTPTTSNQAPVLSPIGSKNGVVNQKLEIRLSASDPEGNPLTFSASGLPAGASFSSTLFSWTPSQVGTYNVTFSVSDGKATDSETVKITIGATTPVPTPVPAPVPTNGNTTAVIISVPIASGGVNEYNLSVRITTTTVSGVSVGQTVWLAAKVTDFPNLLTAGATISGNLDKSLGWWVLKPST